MANIYVRKSGSDSNDGSTPALAKLTIAGAISAMNSGDIIYVGSGVYREGDILTGQKTVTIIGDITGEHTGDAGEVIWSGMDLTDTINNSYSYIIKSDGEGYGIYLENILFTNFKITLGTGCIQKDNYGDFIIKKCTLYSIFVPNNAIRAIHYHHTNTSSSENIILEDIKIINCISYGTTVGRGIEINTQTTSNNTLSIKNIYIDNCFSSYSSSSTFTGVYARFYGTLNNFENYTICNCNPLSRNNDGIRGIDFESNKDCDFYNCSMYNCSARGLVGLFLCGQTHTYTGHNCSVHNNIVGTDTEYYIVEDNWVRKANYVIPKVSHLSRFSPLKGAGSTTFPATDIDGNPRPVYGNGTACDIGAVESTSDIIQKESTIKDSGDYSIKVSPCNYFKKTFQVPVTASTLRTVKVKIRIDGTWGTYLPRVSLSGQGMTLSQDTKNSTTGSFEELTVSGTPTTTGIALLTIEAHSANTDAAFYIDTITIE